MGNQSNKYADKLLKGENQSNNSHLKQAQGTLEYSGVNQAIAV